MRTTGPFSPRKRSTWELAAVLTTAPDLRTFPTLRGPDCVPSVYSAEPLTVRTTALPAAACAEAVANTASRATPHAIKIEKDPACFINLLLINQSLSKPRQC